MRTIVFLVAGFLLLASVLPAQQHPSYERGIDPEKMYELGEIDEVNLLNGNIKITIPLGQEYPVGGGLTYRLSLTYNAKAWDHQEAYYQGRTYSQAVPDRRSNAGMGWILSLGRLLGPTDPTNDYGAGSWVYIGSDGAEHVFYAGLQNPGQAGVDPCGTACYTRDSSYLRMRRLSTIQRVVEFPDGIRHFFDLQTLSDGTQEWRLTAIRDRFEDGLRDVEITYPNDLTWEIRDKHNRLHKVIFQADPSGRYKRIVQRVELSAFNSTSPAVYSFLYLPPQAVTVPCSSNLPYWTEVSVSLLSSVILPDGSSYGLQYYHPTYGGDCRANGLISTVWLPTGGKIDYGYRLHTLPIQGCSFREWHAYSAGIAYRRHLDAAGNELGRWTYTSSLSQPPQPPFSYQCDNGQFFRPAPEEVQVTVVTPLKDKTVHYFSVFPGDESGPSTYSTFDPLDYGLPFSRLPAKDSTGTRYLSTETFDCDLATGACPATPARSTYVRYERDSAVWVECPSGFFGQICFDTNRRLASQRIVYHDDGKFADLDSSDFDGFGNYRVVSTGGNFTADDNRTTFTNYNSGNVLPSASGSWVLKTYNEQWVEEGGRYAKQQFCFDPDTGFLKRQRTYSDTNLGTNPKTNDLLVMYTPEVGTGNVAREDRYGGDKAPQALSLSTDLCNLALPAAGSEFRTDHTYQYGVRATSTDVDAAGIPLSFKSVDQTIDWRTGLVASSRDTAGVQTNYTYDLMGRLVTAKPQWSPAAAWSEYTYTRAQGTTPARIDLKMCNSANLTTCSVLTYRQIEYDSLGRIAKERQLLFDITWSKRVTTYDGMGFRSSVSELQPDATADTSLKKTTFSGYDPFGRPTTVTPPDGSAHNVTFTYTGVSQVRRDVKIGSGTLDVNGNVPETVSSTTEIYDRHGRLRQVSEPSSPSGSNVVTEYTYDVGNRIGVVKVAAPEGDQFRFFSYDNRGLLLAETFPEKGGQVRYSDYNSRGLLGRKEDVVGVGPNVLVYLYDRGGRPTEIRQDSANGPLLKKFTYAGASTACGLCNGKLHQARRYNYHTVGTTLYEAVIEETYTYGARGGLVSRRDTKLFVNGPQYETFTQTFDYNHRGVLESLGYPQCQHLECTDDYAAFPRTVQFYYWLGFLTEVTGFTGTVPGQPTGKGITYHANGMVHQVQHSNGVLDTQAVDAASWMPRPLSISTSNALANWSSGTYRYDGAGNVVKMGTDWFRYDRVSRIQQGVVHTDPSGAGGLATQRAQSYTYDTHGNLQAVTTQVGAGSPQTRYTPSSAATNRLTGAVTYDAAGNLTSWNGNTYKYDPFNQMKELVTGGKTWLYSYTAGDERVWAFDLYTPRSHWTLRDLDGRVLRDYENNSGLWKVASDYVYRDGRLLAAVRPGGQVVHFHLDHLGTPRLITDSARQALAYHAYYPYGEEATAFNQDAERMKFTGHERDLADPAGPGDDLDSMHVRHYSFLNGRFLSVDPSGQSFVPAQPQSWNRYAYVQGSPLKYVDPKGEILDFIGTQLELLKLQAIANHFLHGFDLVVNNNGRASLQPNNEVGPATPEQAALAGVLSMAINHPSKVTIKLVTGSPDTLIGSYEAEKLDVQDLAAQGIGPGINAAGSLAHEISEQSGKQIFGMKNNRADLQRAHTLFGIPAQNLATGFTRSDVPSSLPGLPPYTGAVVIYQDRGLIRVEGTITFDNGNVVNVQRTIVPRPR